MQQQLIGEDAIAQGQDATIRFRVLAPETVRLEANAGAAATTLEVAPLRDPLEDGDILLFDHATIVVVDGNHAAGIALLTVEATVGPLNAGDIGRKLRDLTGYTIEFEVVASGTDAEPLIEDDDVTVTLATQTGSDRGYVDVTIPAVASATLQPDTYEFHLWSRGSGSKRPLAGGPLQVVAKGFV